MKNNLITISGFRATGKSTLAIELAKVFDWQLFDTDLLIEKKASMNIADLTNNGTRWEEFRQLELEVLKEVITKKNAVISLGGGVGVNNIVDTKTSKTFGELQLEIINGRDSFNVLLTAPWEVIEKRIREKEMEKDDVTRPVLDPKEAEELQKLIGNYKGNLEKQKQIIVNKIIKDSKIMYEKRKNLYRKLSDITFDTENDSIEIIINKIKNLK